MQKLRIIVMASIARLPYPGTTWQVLHYMEGFRRLGHDVYYVEDNGQWPFYASGSIGLDEACLNAAAHINDALAWAGMGNRWAYRAAAQDGRVYGMSNSRYTALLQSSDVLVNLTGATKLREEHQRVAVRIFLQTDPGRVEVMADDGDVETLEYLRDHTHFFNYGENLGTSGCLLPAGSFAFKPTRQPVILDWFSPRTRTSRKLNGKSAHGNDKVKKAAEYEAAIRALGKTQTATFLAWQADATKEDELQKKDLRFTTVGNWKQTGNDVVWNGEKYTWSKHSEFLKVLDLPKRVGQPLELALSSLNKRDCALLRRHGWKVVDARSISATMFDYRDYIEQSDAEFTVAKDQNIRMRTGWFSDRSACYLACGKPVIAQDTAFGKNLPTGCGLFSFQNIDEITAAIEAIRSDYGRESREARRIAEEYFRADRVLGELLAGVGI
jgi:hypothetical protein